MRELNFQAREVAYVLPLEATCFAASKSDFSWALSSGEVKSLSWELAYLKAAEFHCWRVTAVGLAVDLFDAG